jgi:hypothetical protein
VQVSQLTYLLFKKFTLIQAHPVTQHIESNKIIFITVLEIYMDLGLGNFQLNYHEFCSLLSILRCYRRDRERSKLQTAPGSMWYV